MTLEAKQRWMKPWLGLTVHRQFQVHTDDCTESMVPYGFLGGNE
jgi:hypothetical protein